MQQIRASLQDIKTYSKEMILREQKASINAIASNQSKKKKASLSDLKDIVLTRRSNV